MKITIFFKQKCKKFLTLTNLISSSDLKSECADLIKIKLEWSKSFQCLDENEIVP